MFIKKLIKILKPYMTRELAIILIASICFLLFQNISSSKALKMWIDQTFGRQIQHTRDIQGYYRYISVFVTGFVFFFLVPYLSSLLLLRKKTGTFPSIKLKKSAFGIKLSLIFLSIMLVVIVIALFLIPELSQYYPLVKYSTHSLGTFLLFQFTFFLYVVSWEYFSHSFLLFPFEEKMGAYSILVGLMPFIILHLGKPLSEQLGSAIAGLALVILARETRTFWYGALLHATISIMVNAGSYVFNLFK